jgi:hypothetical protein
MKELGNATEGTPRIQQYEIANSTVHNIASKAA